MRSGRVAKIAAADFVIRDDLLSNDQNRPERQRLKSDIDAGAINFVLTVKMERVTRSLLDLAELRAFFRKHDTQFISLRANFDASGPMGEVMFGLVMVLAELERNLTAERSAMTTPERADRGLWHGEHVVGDVSDENEAGYRVPNPEDALLVKIRFFDAFEALGCASAVWV